MSRACETTAAQRDYHNFASKIQDLQIQQLMFTEVEAAYWVLITLRIENSPKESKFWVLILTLTALITKREMNDEETFTVY